MQTCLDRKEEAALGILQPAVEAGRLFASRDKPNLLCGAQGNGYQGGSLGTPLSRAVPAPEHFQGTKRAQSSPEEPFPGISLPSCSCSGLCCTHTLALCAGRGAVPGLELTAPCWVPPAGTRHRQTPRQCRWRKVRKGLEERL